jgi:hypothetical protein
VSGALLEEVVVTGTGASASKRRPALPYLSQPMAAMGLVIPGGLTAVSAFHFPFELLDATSADVIELPTPWFALGELNSGPGSTERAESGVQELVERVKRKSGLTWGVLAEALGLEKPRAIHLWRGGGGINATNEERLHELDALIDSIDLGSAADVRAELLDQTPSGSLLERLRAGESPRQLITAAPWRTEARTELIRNIEALGDDEGILDEDFLFLLEADNPSTFEAEARSILDDAGSSRRDWERLLDSQYAALTPPPTPPDFADADDDEDDPEAITPLFRIADLGIKLGVGAIAAGRTAGGRS